ncbi:MAG: diguanylate cyclase [Lachnospiraceae bacterium]|nr:diguanylate cyclase [Lachnospiraceae bacterium]
MGNWVAIVDDDVANLTVASHILYKEQLKVSAFRSGKELLLFLNHNRPDLVLLDVHMPELDGFATLAAIRAQDALDGLPVIFLTGDEDIGTEAKGLAAGAEDFIKKPFVPEILLLRVKHTIELARLRSDLASEVERKTNEIIMQHEQIRNLSIAAETDQMTGLLNKVSAQEAISQRCREVGGILMMIDLDSFKLINDIYGHNAGDRILIRFAEIIRSAIRTTDLAGRMGGDEFVAFCENMKDESVINEKSRYINDEIVAFAKDFLGDDLTVPLGASIGAVVCPDEGRDFLTLYKKADEALYSVKRSGKHGCAFYWESRRPNVGFAASGSSHAMAILEEREGAPEALVLSFEQFRLVYRLLVRLNRNYTIRTAFILFTISGPQEQAAAATDRFCKIVAASLRSSDAVAKSSANQCMVLLLHTDIQYGETVAARMVKNWHHAGDTYGCDVEYEIEIL